MRHPIVFLLILMMVLLGCERAPTSNAHVQVVAHLKNGKYQEAMLLIRSGLEKNPLDRDLLQDRLVLLLESDDPAARDSILEIQKTLDAIGAGRRTLIEQADNRSPKARRHVAYLLGRLGEESGLKTLRTLADNTDDDVRAEAVQAMGRIKSPKSNFFLLVRLRDGYWKVRAEAANALAAINDSGVSAQLFRNLNDRDAYVRSQILEAILTLANTSEEKLYLKELESEIPIHVTAAALALGKLRRSESVPVLIKLLIDKRSEERKRIAQTLADLRPDSVAQTLENLLFREADPDVKGALLDYFQSRGEADLVKKYR